jgi:hypothetical protein
MHKMQRNMITTEGVIILKTAEGLIIMDDISVDVTNEINLSVIPILNVFWFGLNVDRHTY